MSDSNEWIIGLDPRTPLPRPVDDRLGAPRPTSLVGATVALISNTKGQARAFLEALHEELVRIAGVTGKLLIEKATVNAEPTPEDWVLIRSQATVGITAFGG